MQLPRIISAEHAVGAWEDTQSDSAKERRHLSQSTTDTFSLNSFWPGFLLKNWPKVWDWVAAGQTGPWVSQDHPDLGMYSYGGSATHPPGCFWTSQSRWPWSTNSTQRPSTSLKPGTLNGKPEAATLVAAALKACVWWLFLLERNLVFSHCFSGRKNICVSFECYCLGHLHF